MPLTVIFNVLEIISLILSRFSILYIQFLNFSVFSLVRVIDCRSMTAKLTPLIWALLNSKKMVIFLASLSYFYFLPCFSLNHLYFLIVFFFYRIKAKQINYSFFPFISFSIFLGYVLLINTRIHLLKFVLNRNYQLRVRSSLMIYFFISDLKLLTKIVLYSLRISGLLHKKIIEKDGVK